MKSKASLVLMEQLVMLLVFALAAAACLGIFAAAHTTALSARRQDDAVLLAQNCAEALKSSAGNLNEIAVILGGTLRQDQLSIPCEDGLCVRIQKNDSGTAGLGQAAVTVVHEDDGTVFSLTVCWQEVFDHDA